MKKKTIFHVGKGTMSPTLLFTNILLGYTLQLASGAFRLLHPGGYSSYSWVSVCALGHNSDKDRTFTLYPLFEKVLSNKEYTRLLA